jgi:hypothetical protein
MPILPAPSCSSFTGSPRRPWVQLEVLNETVEEVEVLGLCDGVHIGIELRIDCL